MSNVSVKLDDKALAIETQFAESMPGGFFIYRATGDENFIYVNSATLRIFGCETEGEFRALTKNSFKTMVHPDDIEEVERSIKEQIESSVYDLDYVEYRIIRKDGQVRWIVDYGHFVHTEVYGDVFYVFIDDATEKHRLQMEDRRKQSVIEGLSNGYNSIYLVNLEQRTMTPYAWDEPVAEEIVRDTFKGSHVERDFYGTNNEFAEKYIIPEDQATYLKSIDIENIKSKITKNKSILYIFRCANGNGDYKYIQLSIAPVKGESQFAVQVLKNVTEQMQKIQDENMQTLKMEFELNNALLENNAKSSFLFNMSHDLKTPINAIMGFAELAQKNIDGDKNRVLNYLEKIRISGNLLVNLINAVLNMTQIESGNLKLKEEPCNLRKQAEILTDVFRSQIAEKKLNYNLSLEIAHENIFADTPNLNRILSNILQNAVNYTPNGGSISFSISESENTDLCSEKKCYTFIVSDTGCGVDEDLIERMWQPFVRGQNTTASKIAGTGLGLTITKKLVEAMGGTAESQSQIGMGTTITIKIPFKECRQQEQDLSEEITKHKWTSSNKENKRVLLVEDNELNREITLEILHEGGIEVDAACDGLEALKIFKASEENYYDLILMDIQMPRMNGYEATKAIRALDRKDAASIPIFAITANTLESDKLRAYKSGMNQVIEKPVNMDFLSKLLRKL